MVPIGEYFFVPPGAARIITIGAVPGKSAPTPLMQVASGALRGVGDVSPAVASAIKVGQSAEIFSEVSGLTAHGVIAGMRERVTAETGALSGRYDVVVNPVGSWDKRLWGADVRLTVSGASTGVRQLVVPVSALFATADGATRVQVHNSDGSTRTVTVTVGVNTGGFAAIREVGGPLVEGDLVEISAANTGR
jgi:hypothetical protein